MNHAEQQAYEVLLNEAIETAQKWEYLARAAMVSHDCVETCLMIGKPDAALHEIDNARRHFERMTEEAA
jgi:hypothetical protein